MKSGLIKKKEVLQSGEKIVDKLNELVSSRVETSEDLNKDIFEDAFRRLLKFMMMNTADLDQGINFQDRSFIIFFWIIIIIQKEFFSY